MTTTTTWKLLHSVELLLVELHLVELHLVELLLREREREPPPRLPQRLTSFAR